jgi:hypothetical protein
MAGRKPSGLTVLLAAAILIAAVLLFWALAGRTVDETRELTMPSVELPDAPPAVPPLEPPPVPTPGPT